MNFVEYYQLSPDQKRSFFLFLETTYIEQHNLAHLNMWDKNWHECSNTLPYILEYTDRFKNGKFSILFNDDTIVGCSGVYESNFCSDLVIAGTRTWIDKNYRNKNIARDFLLPNEKAWAIENNYKAIALTFNEYNKNLIKIWNKRRLGEKRSARQPYHIFYDNLNSVNFKVNIQFTSQYVIYEKLNPHFNYDWSLIKS